MTAAMFQGEGGFQTPVGQQMKGVMPGPVQALSQGSVGGPMGPVMSDLQNMMANEQKQHQGAYMNMFGHNDHGMGQ